MTKTDSLNKNPTGYGVDVACSRADDLDKKLLNLVKEETANSVLDLGGGMGGQALRLVLNGSNVVSVDINNFQDTFYQLCEAYHLSPNKLKFIQGNISELPNFLPDTNFDFCLFQRAIHYLPYQEAKNILQYLHSHINKKLFISVTGLDTDIGKYYLAVDKPLTERFDYLKKEDQTIFSITKPLCLYSPTEFIELLVATGWQIEECWISAFGNIKVVAKTV